MNINCKEKALIALILFSIESTILPQELLIDQAAGYDFINTNQINVNLWISLKTNAPLAQSFTPSLPGIGFVQFILGDRQLNNGQGATVLVNLRQDAYNGPIMSSTTPVAYLDNYKGISTLYFPDNVPLMPGSLYFLEPIVQSGDDWGTWMYNLLSAGFAVVNGRQMVQNSLWFREGLVVPEPKVWAMIVVGMGLLILRRFLQWLHYFRRIRASEPGTSAKY